MNPSVARGMLLGQSLFQAADNIQYRISQGIIGLLNPAILVDHLRLRLGAILSPPPSTSPASVVDFAVPKRRTSRRTIRIRHRAYVPKNRDDIIRCEACNNLHLLHTVCPFCFKRYNNLIRLCMQNGLRDYPEIVTKTIEKYQPSLPKMTMHVKKVSK